jgi:hypothetical protein
LTVSKAKKLRRKLPVAPVGDYESAYRTALEVVREMNEQIDQLNRLLDWCSPRMKDEICKGTLSNMRIDPTQIPVREKKKVPPKSAPEKPPSEKDCFSVVDQREVTPMVDDMPEDVATYLLFTPEDEMNWIGDNFDRMTWLRNKGFFVLVGADNRVGLPPKLSPLGISVVEMLKKRRL